MTRDRPIISLARDALGRRIVEGSNPGTGDFINESTHVHLYYNANWQVVQETNFREDGLGGTYDTTVSNVWSPAYIDALILRDTDFIYDDGGVFGFGQFSSGNPGVQRPTPPDGRVYVQQDANFNVTSITGTNGAVLEHLDANGSACRTTSRRQ